MELFNTNTYFKFFKIYIKREKKKLFIFIFLFDFYSPSWRISIIMLILVTFLFFRRNKKNTLDFVKTLHKKIIIHPIIKKKKKTEIILK